MLTLHPLPTRCSLQCREEEGGQLLHDPHLQVGQPGGGQGMRELVHQCLRIVLEGVLDCLPPLLPPRPCLAAQSHPGLLVPCEHA